MEATLDDRIGDAEECRRLAYALQLDAVGVLRRDAGGRTVTWWAAPGSPALPLGIDSIVQGRADGWIAAPRGDDVVFGRLTDRSSVRSVTALGSMLSGLAPETADVGGVAPEDSLARERTRWAYAIHDGLTQIVTAAILDLEWLSRQAQVEPSTAQRALTDAGAELRTALEEIRTLLAMVTPDEGAYEHERSLGDLLQRVAERWHVPASWSIDGDLEGVPTPVMDAATSVIRESVANAAKHSASREVAVHVQARPTEMQITVEDGGRGFRAQETGPHAGHLGLEMMRRRVAEVNGTLDIESEPGRGTRVTARLPVEEGETP